MVLAHNESLRYEEKCFHGPKIIKARLRQHSNPKPANIRPCHPIH